MVLEVCVAVVLREGRVLVRRRPRGSHLPGAWEFPGGKRRRGERGRACAARECLEETGLRVAAGALLARARHAYPDRVVDLRFFACAVAGGRLRRSPSLRWVGPAALRRMPIPEANRPILGAIEAAAAHPGRPPRGASGRGRRGRATPPSRRKAR